MQAGKQCGKTKTCERESKCPRIVKWTSRRWPVLRGIRVVGFSMRQRNYLLPEPISGCPLP